jgi:hypothetical protein
MSTVQGNVHIHFAFLTSIQSMWSSGLHILYKGKLRLKKQEEARPPTVFANLI